MKIKYSKLVIGVILGCVISFPLSIFANQMFDVYPNPFNIKINGDNVSIEGYNINGSTYFKLRDIGDKVGFTVDFKEDTIMIDTDEAIQNDNEETSNVTDCTIGFYNKVMEKWSRHNYIIIEHAGTKYIEISALNNIGILTDIRLPVGIKLFDTHCKLEINDELLEPEMQIHLLLKSGYITYSDFEQHVKPHIDQMLDERGIVKGSLE